MKKIIFTIGISLMLNVLALSSYGQRHVKKQFGSTKIKNNHADGLTLNGLSFDDANTYVKNFYEDNTSSDNKTNFWLSENWIKGVRLLFDSNQTFDGFRIYFAKNNANYNTVVIVPTTNSGKDPRAPSKADHEDYYNFKSTEVEAIKKFTTVNDIQELHDKGFGTTLYRTDPTDFSICSSSNGCIITSINHNISCSEALTSVDNFTKKTINTICEWYPRSVIEALDDELKAAKLDTKLHPDGIRFYFAKDKYKRHCFIVVTTEKNASGDGHADYYNCHIDTKGLFNKGLKDHGEECPINCNTVTLPQP